MASAEFQFDTRIRRYHVPLKTQQRRLRHLHSVAARNVVCSGIKHSAEMGLYYTLHQTPDSDAFYTSEVIMDNLNPTWKDFEPCNFPENVVLSSPYMAIKIWNTDNKLLTEWVLFFSGLHFVGKQIPKEGKNFKCNTLIFGMLEGYYGCKDYYEPLQDKIMCVPSYKDCFSADFSVLRVSCALSTLGRIKTVEQVIWQTRATASRLKRKIEAKMQETENLHLIHSSKELLAIKVSLLRVEVYRQRNYLMALEKQVLQTSEKLSDDQSALKNMLEELQKSREKLSDMWHTSWEFRENLLKTEAQLVFRRKELVSDLSSIYPVVQFPDQTGFSIHNVHLPDSENLSGHDEVMISVALGYVCHMLLMISQFLNVPLRYEMQFNGSKSSIIDHISSTIPVKNRIFPLYSKGKDRRFFEYAVYLLNKNIAQLRMLLGLTTKELSATLPNLHGLIEHRLSFSNDAGVIARTLGPSSVHFEASEDGTKDVSVVQNGSPFISDSLQDISCKILDSANSEMENLHKELSEMVPGALNSGETHGIVPQWINDVSSTLRGSLDKGLDDIKVLESTHASFVSSNSEKLRMKQMGQTFHHSSFPNLISSFPQGDNCNCVDALSNTPPESTTPLRMWITSSSTTNSEEEPVDDSFPSGSTSEATVRDSHFFVYNDWTIVQREHCPSSKTNSDLVPIDSSLVNEHDFNDDLTLRAEQLANRSSSFQMQKIASLSIDSGQLHPS